MPTVTEVLDLATGVRVPYLESGDPDGVPLVVLHGYSDSALSNAPLLAALPRSIHAFALTARGHGDASRPAGGYTPSDMAADVAAFADARGLGPIVVVGHSMGSYAAQAFAVEHPDRTRAVILLGAFRTFGGNADNAGLLDDVEKLTDPVDEAFVREFQLSTLAHRVPDEYLEMVIAESRKMPAAVLQRVMRDLCAADPPTHGGRIEAPLLAIWGDRDAFAPRADQDRLVREAADARLVVYEGSGHAMHWEDPERVAADIAAFVEALR